MSLATPSWVVESWYLAGQQANPRFSPLAFFFRVFLPFAGFPRREANPPPLLFLDSRILWQSPPPPTDPELETGVCFWESHDFIPIKQAFSGLFFFLSPPIPSPSSHIAGSRPFGARLKICPSSLCRSPSPKVRVTGWRKTTLRQFDDSSFFAPPFFPTPATFPLFFLASKWLMPFPGYLYNLLLFFFFFTPSSSESGSQTPTLSAFSSPRDEGAFFAPPFRLPLFHRDFPPLTFCLSPPGKNAPSFLFATLSFSFWGTRDFEMLPFSHFFSPPPTFPYSQENLFQSTRPSLKTLLRQWPL